MSATRQVTLWCDGTDDGNACGEWIQTEGIEQPTVPAIRARAKRGGWSRNGGLDYCPRHLTVAHTRSTGPVHWVGDAPTSLHGNGAASFDRTTRDAAEVTCKLCLTLLDREPTEP